MAPIEPDFSNASLQATAGLAGYALTSVALTTLICYDVLYKSYKALPPSQDTRSRQSNREKHVRAHTLLAIAALATSCYHTLDYAFLSYRVWAQEMGHEVPVLRTLGWDIGSQYHIGRWWKDTNLLQDAWEIVIDRSRRYWWAEQHLLGTASWAMFVGIEGRRRNIHRLWAFILLAQFVSLSFAVNLFFLAILLSPMLAPSTAADPSSRDADHFQVRLAFLPDSVNNVMTFLRTYLPLLPTHPHAHPWTPSPYAYIPTTLALQIATYLLPYTTHTPQFSATIAIINISTLRLAYMARLTPVAYGSNAYPSRNYTSVYRITSFISLLLHIKSTAVAMLDNDPGAYPLNHPHSRYLAALRLPHEHERSRLTRSRLGFTRVLTSLNDHPIVAMIGYDVLLTALSLCTWATLRGLDVEKILYSAGVVHVKPLTAADAASVDAITGISTSELSDSKPRRHKKKSTVTANASPFLVTSEVDTPTPANRTRHETRDKDITAKDDRTFQSSAATSNVLKGEEPVEENLEAGAVGGALCVLGGLGVLVNGVLGAESDS